MRLKITSPAGAIEFHANLGETTIGRSEESNWVIPSDKLSRCHCVVYISKDKESGMDQFAIMDPGSKNGVMVDGVRIEHNKRVPISRTSMILLANQFILNVGTANKVEMIDSSVKSPAPVKKRTAYDKVSERDERRPAKIPLGRMRALIRKLAFLTFSAVGLAGALTYFFIFK